MITLDYDNIAYSELKKRINYILKSPICKSVLIYQSTSCDGYHVYVKTTRKLNFNHRIQYRKLFKDDGTRIVLDLLKDEQCKEVLFSIRRKKGIKFERIFLEEIIN